jgi:hypothetical protein
MNNWYLNIPKKIHFYWSGKMPYLRYLSALSFKKLNPGWEIILWTSKYKSKLRTWNTGELNYAEKWDDWSDRFSELCNEVYEVDFAQLGVRNDISEVHKSDLLRYWVLNKYGGVYSDTDIVYFNPIVNLSVNRKENQVVETFVCICNYGHSIGFLMASLGSGFFGRMFNEACEVDMVRYQSIGPDLCNMLFPNIESINDFYEAVNIGMDAVYYHNGQHIDELYKGNDMNFPYGSIGVHWYAGSPLSGYFLNSTNGGLKNLPDNIVGKLCKASLDGKTNL